MGCVGVPVDVAFGEAQGLAGSRAKLSSPAGFEPATSGLEVQRAIHCATGTDDALRRDNSSDSGVGEGVVVVVNPIYPYALLPVHRPLPLPMTQSNQSLNHSLLCPKVPNATESHDFLKEASE